MAVRLFIGNLPYDTTEAELREHFSAVGPLTYARLATDRETGRPRGFAFIEFGERSQAEEAVRRFNNQPFKGRAIAVNEARPRDDHARTSAPSRPPLSRPLPPPGPAPDRSHTSGEKVSRDFGPDAPPRRISSKKKGPKSERAPKGPMREVVRGQFFGDDNDIDEDDLSGENFASRVDASEDEGDE